MGGYAVFKAEGLHPEDVMEFIVVVNNKEYIINISEVTYKTTSTPPYFAIRLTITDD
ncbi:hypothetical protein ACFL3Q_03485 [Planctomycetota bacterium]